MSEAPPKELQEQLPHDPRLWAANFLRHPNEPSRKYDFYDTQQENRLWYLLDEDGPMNPENWGDINVLLFARGCLKTFTVSTIAAWVVDMFPSAEVVITAPVDDQREEVIDRFDTKVEQSGLDARRERDAMGHMKFKNKSSDPETGESYTSYSHMKSRTAWGDGDKLRGLHGHVGIIDESQDVDEGTFSTFLEAIDRQTRHVDYFPTIFVIGTPKLTGTFFHRLWQMSDQKTWDRDSRDWVVESEGDEFLPEDMSAKKVEMEQKVEQLEDEREDADDERAEEIDALIEQFEEKLDDIEGFTVRGWHLDQENSPLHDDMRIAFKKETYSKKKVENEVYAHFFSPEHDLITNDDVWETAFVDRGFAEHQRHENTLTVLGCDWGGGSGEGAAKTAVAVAEVSPDGDTLEVLYGDILDSDMSHSQEREKIDRLMEKYQVDVGVVDEGFGDTDREELQDEYGYDHYASQSIYGCWYGNVKDKEEVKWNRKNDERRFFTANKSYMVKHMAEDFKAGSIEIPRDDLSFDTKRSTGSMIVSQLTAPYTEKKQHESGKNKIVVQSDRNDDFFDALTFVWIAAKKVFEARPNRGASSHKRRGYT